MARFIVFLFISFLAVDVHAQTLVRSPRTKAEYCALAHDARQMIALARETESRLSFENPYGYFSTGLCWWHSHLQRASVYLTYYKPAAAKPTASQVYGILRSIYFNHDVTVIPGYANFYDFTLDNQKIVTNFLSDVEILATAGGDWVHGVIGASAVTAANLQLKMDQLYKTFSARSALIYEMLQMPGFNAHAWLVEDIVPTADGYMLTVIDSNFPLENSTYAYRRGQTRFPYPNEPQNSFVPYIYDQSQLATFTSRAANYCGLP